MTSAIDIEATAASRHRLGSAGILILSLAGSLLLFQSIWTRDAVADVVQQPGGWVVAIAVAALSAIVHELLHAVGWMGSASVRWQVIWFGRTWRKLGIAAHVGVPIRAGAGRISAALPALMLAFPTIAVGLATNRGLLLMWGLFFLFECFADLTLLLATASVPATAWVVEHPTKIGWRVVEP